MDERWLPRRSEEKKKKKKFGRKVGKTNEKLCLLASPFEPPLVAGKRETEVCEIMHRLCARVLSRGVNWPVATISRFAE